MNTGSQLHSNPYHLAPYFKQYWIPVLATTVVSFFLGLITAFLGASMGPAFEVLFSDATHLQLTDFFSEFVSQFLIKQGSPASIEKSKLLLSLPAVIFGLALIKFVATFVVFFFWEYFSEKIGYIFRQGLAKEFLEASPSKIFLQENRQLTEKLPTAIGNDIRQVRQYVVRFYGSMPRELFQVFFLILAMLFISPKLFMLFFLAVSPLAIVIAKLGKKLKRRSSTALQFFSGLSDWIMKRLLGFETIKQLRTESQEIAAMKAKSTELNSKYDAIARTRSILPPLVETVSVIGLGVVLYVSSLLILDETASASAQISFFSCLALLGQASAKLGRYVNIQAEGRAAMEHLQEYSQRVRAVKEITSPTTLGGRAKSAVAVKVDKLRIDKGVHFVFNLPQFEFEKSKMYGLCGVSGSGKSTLIEAVLGVTAPTSGRAEVFTPPNQGTSLQRLFLSQEYLPFHGTIRENISYPLPADGVSDQVFLNSLLKAGWIDPSVDFLDKKIGLALPSLSGGQLQRLSLARVFYHKPPLIILDECTSALDAHAEAIVLNSLRQLVLSGASILMAAHKELAIEACDEILHFEKGELIWNGDLSDYRKKDFYPFKSEV